jgi:hypothetical protein
MEIVFKFILLSYWEDVDWFHVAQDTTSEEKKLT